MSLTKKIAFNTFWQITGRFLGLFLSLISLGLITRYLKQDGFGAYTTILAFIQLFSIIADFGLTLISIQLISEINEANISYLKEKTDNLFSNIFTLRLVLSIVALLIGSVVVWFFPYSSTIKYGVMISGLSFLFVSLAQTIQSVYQKEMKMIKPAIAELLSKAFFLVGTILTIFYDWKIYSILIFLILSGLVHFILMFFWSRTLIKIRLKFNRQIWLDILKKSWPIAVSIIFNLIYLKADIIILSLYSDQNIVGLYGAAYRAIDVLSVFPYLFIGMLLPLITSAWAKQDLERFKKIVQQGFDGLTVFALPIIIGVVFLAKPIMVIIAGAEFESAGNILKVLIIGIGMIYLGNVFSHTVVAINKQKEMMWSFGFVAITSLIGYFILIPRFSYWGAAIITIYSESLIAILSFIMVVKTSKIKINFNVLLKSVVASAIMGLLLFFTNSWSIFIVIPLAIILYFAIMILINGIDKKLIKEIISKPSL